MTALSIQALRYQKQSVLISSKKMRRLRTHWNIMIRYIPLINCQFVKVYFTVNFTVYFSSSRTKRIFFQRQLPIVVSLNPSKIPDEEDEKSCCCIPIPLSTPKTNKEQQLLELLSDIVKEQEDFESFLQGQRDLVITIGEAIEKSEQHKKMGQNNEGYINTEEKKSVAEGAITKKNFYGQRTGT